MQTVIDCFHIGKYAILIFDKMPHDFNAIKVGDRVYLCNVPYDIPNAIAIESAADFKGKGAEFISTKP